MQDNQNLNIIPNKRGFLIVKELPYKPRTKSKKDDNWNHVNKNGQVVAGTRDQTLQLKIKRSSRTYTDDTVPVLRNIKRCQTRKDRKPTCNTFIMDILLNAEHYSCMHITN